MNLKISYFCTTRFSHPKCWFCLRNSIKWKKQNYEMPRYVIFPVVCYFCLLLNFLSVLFSVIFRLLNPRNWALYKHPTQFLHVTPHCNSIASSSSALLRNVRRGGFSSVEARFGASAGSRVANEVGGEYVLQFLQYVVVQQTAKSY